MSDACPIIGVLALQGAVAPHFSHIEAAGMRGQAVKYSDDFDAVDGLIIPGGESSTMLKLIEKFSLGESLIEFAKHKSIWGICAGAILMAKKVSDPDQKSFAIVDCDVQRNAYGRQLESFQTDVLGYDVSFIRAPKISRVGVSCEVLAEHNGDPVFVKCGRHYLSTFHPELNSQRPSPFHTNLFHRFIQVSP